MLAGDAKVAPSVPFLFQQVTVCVEKDPDGDERVCDHLGPAGCVRGRSEPQRLGADCDSTGRGAE